MAKGQTSSVGFLTLFAVRVNLVKNISYLPLCSDEWLILNI